MEAACRRTAYGLRFRPPRIPHVVVFMVIAIAFHTEDPDRVGGTLNILLLPSLSPFPGSESVLITCFWDTF